MKATNNSSAFIKMLNNTEATVSVPFKHPRLAGYDLNSRFELKPGEKDPERIRTFLNELKS